MSSHKTVQVHTEVLGAIKNTFTLHGHVVAQLVEALRYSWLRHCAASQKVTGSIPDGVIGIFHRLNLPGRIMALGLNQLLTEMSTRNISWGVKAAGV